MNNTDDVMKAKIMNNPEVIKAIEKARKQAIANYVIQGIEEQKNNKDEFYIQNNLDAIKANGELDTKLPAYIASGTPDIQAKNVVKEYTVEYINDDNSRFEKVYTVRRLSIAQRESLLMTTVALAEFAGINKDNITTTSDIDEKIQKYIHENVYSMNNPVAYIKLFEIACQFVSVTVGEEYDLIRDKGESLGVLAVFADILNSEPRILQSGIDFFTKPAGIVKTK